MGELRSRYDRAQWFNYEEMRAAALPGNRNSCSVSTGGEMAMQANQNNRENLSCSICLDLLKDPVTLGCGHTFCMSCINDCWDEDDERKKTCSCPQCRQSFMPRPVLMKNTMMAELVEELKKSGVEDAPPAHFYAGPGDVACDFCSGPKLKALKSCLTCLASFCEQHLQPHYDVAPLKKHKLVAATSQLQDNVCSLHDKVMEIFCRTDRRCICYLCTLDEHKGHDTVSIMAERAERQAELEASRKNLQQRVLEAEKEVEELRQRVESVDRSADEAVRDSARIFKELIRLIETRSSELEQRIRSQQRSQVGGAKELEEKLQQEITELRRRDAELEQLERTQDHLHFLNRFPSPSRPDRPQDSPTVDPRGFGDVAASVSEARDKVLSILSEEWTKISLVVTGEEVSPPQAEPTTRAEFIKYSCQITLDPNTADSGLSLSDGNRKATVGGGNQKCLDHPDRFINYYQVLSRDGLTGRCYWEVNWRGRRVDIAVAYKNISRTGYESLFGNNDKSWSLECNYDGSYFFRHNKAQTKISGPKSSRIGVYLDHRAGTLSYYSVSETMTLLHRVHTKFTQPLHPGFWFYYKGSSAELCELK